MKILLLGLSGSGKSTLSKLVGDKYKLDVYEADDEVEKLNGGLWPDDDNIITQRFEIANKKALLSDNMVYVSSWLEQDKIKAFYNSGFEIIEMHADFDTLIDRKRKRDNITLDKIEKFKNTYTEYFNTILPIEMVEYYKLSIDTTTLTTDEILKNIIAQHIS